MVLFNIIFIAIIAIIITFEIYAVNFWMWVDTFGFVPKRICFVVGTIILAIVFDVVRCKSGSGGGCC